MDPSFQNDEQLARELSRQLNANPRRKSVVDSSAGFSTPCETRRSKRARISKHDLPPTPTSLPSPTTNAQLDNGDLSSSPLSFHDSLDLSPSPSKISKSTKPEQSVSYDTEAPTHGQNLSNTVDAPIANLTNILISEADSRSVPAPGAELLQKVDEARQNFAFSLMLDPRVLRFIDGKWMAPQMCEGCQMLWDAGKKSTRKASCDRHSPCSACVDAGLECSQGTYMTTLRKGHNVTKAIPKLEHGPFLQTLAIASQVYQAIDGTWRCSPETQTVPFITVTQTTPRIRLTSKGRSASAYGINPQDQSSATDERLATVVVQSVTQEPGTSSGSEPQTPPRRGRLLKRKAKDDDFLPSARESSPETQEDIVSTSPEAVVHKKKVAKVRVPGYTKYYQSVQEDKPAPYGQPPVWSDKRQSLCEALPYYKAYQSGAYITQGVVKAFMVDKEVGPRDKLDDEILIARVGGGRKLDEETGVMVQRENQERSLFALGFQRAKDYGLPVAIIAGQGNRLSPSKLPHYYNVLHWFHVTDVWCEISGQYKCWMVRLEKVDLHEKSWWAACNSPPLDPNRDVDEFKTQKISCIRCRRESKEIYNQGWACLNTACVGFFNFGTDVDDAILDYNEDFLRERTSFSSEDLPSLVPRFLTNRDVESFGGAGVESPCKNGIVCPKCHGCSRRIEWHQWKCETPQCDFTYSVAQKIMTAGEAIASSRSGQKEFFDSSLGIRFEQKTMGMYDVFEYIIPGVAKDQVVGIVRHFKAKGLINVQKDGPNDLFRQMQERDFGLKRHAARQKDSTGEILTGHWAANWGAPYKYGVSVLSKGFDEAPPVIIKALKRLTWAGQQTVTENLDPFHPFNELLSIGYFQETAIGYHDDGEKELGPTVATLSLGCQAVMALRPKAKTSIGTTGKNTKGTKPDVLRIILDHGDLVVMHGTGIQKFYEHAITPQGKLRFALTCRYVRPELMENEEERNQAMIKGKLPEGHEQFAYDGDRNATFTEVDENSRATAAQTAMNNIAGMVLAGDIHGADLVPLRELLASVVALMSVDADDIDREFDGADLPMPDLD